MRKLVLPFTLLLIVGLQAQSVVKIMDAKALADAPDVRKVKGLKDTLAAAGFPKVEVETIYNLGERDRWPSGIGSDTARALNAPYILNYTAFRLCSFTEDTTRMALLMVPAKDNIHMPEGLRPLGDFYLVLPEHALKDVVVVKPRPVISRGPRWKGRRKVKIEKADDIYATYDLAADSTGLAALEKAGMSRPEIDAVVFRSTERNWPEGIDSFEDRYPLLEKFHKYRAYLGAKWDDKVLLIVPVEKNRRMPVLMRPFVDMYFVYKAEGVFVRGKKR